VDHHYWYELFMDDLPVWGFVGELKSAAGADPDALVYSHKQLDISYNGDRVSDVTHCLGGYEVGWVEGRPRQQQQQQQKQQALIWVCW
jgi:hypothetical protein